MKKHVLPAQLPFLSMPGTVLLPGGLLPFQAQTTSEKRVIQNALKANRYVGVIQPASSQEEPISLSRIGCVGRVTTFTEGTDDSYFVVLKGISRFEIVKNDTDEVNKRRTITVKYLTANGLDQQPVSSHERVRLLQLLSQYLDTHGLSVNWDDVAQASDETLITSLAMMCPFNAQEKQALLESQSTQDRYQMVMTFLEYAHFKQASQGYMIN
jgi:Lon protease-like protein